MREKEKPISPRIQQAADEYREALDKVKQAKDPLIKEVLRKEAFKKLYEATDITEACELQEKIRLKPQSKN